MNRASGICAAALLYQVFSGTAANAVEPNLAPVHNWAGPYIGVNIGYGELDVGGIFDVGGGEAHLSTLDPQALNGGIGIGINFQSGQLVYGLEADYSWTDMSDSLVDNDTDTQRVSADWFSTIRGRFGVTTGPMLVYLTAGVAFTEVDLNVEINSTNNPDQLSTSETGIAYGAGVEYVIMDGVTLKGEFMHLDFDIAFVTGLGSRLDQLNDGDAGDNFSINGIDVVRIGLNAKLDKLLRRDGSAPHEDFGPAADFSGRYIGVHLGFGELDAGGVFDNDGDKHTAAFGDFDVNGVNGGVQIGYNRQYGHLVYGIEADYTWFDISDTYLDGENDVQRLEADYFATVRARLGAVSNHLMVYVTAGAAFSEFNLIVENGTGRFTDSEVGIAYGGGVEWAISERLRLKAEYLRLDFDAVTLLSGTSLPDVDNDNISFDGYDVVRVGVNMDLDSLFNMSQSVTPE